MSAATALPVTHVEHCMGTAFSFRVVAPGVARAALDDAIAWLHAMDAMFSTYRADSEVSRIDAGRLDVTDASAEVRHVLAECDRFRAETEGWFSAWAGGRLDPSGYVKGWAVQHAADLLARAGSVNHCVNGGGDVACAGRPAPGRGWRIGVADPQDRTRLATTVHAAGPVGVATSGLAERGAHIVDPTTGRPATSVLAVTVVASDLVRADVYATAAAAMGIDRAASWLGTRSGVAALVFGRDGQAHHVGDWSRLR